MERRPVSTDYAPYFAGYIARLPAGDIIQMLAEQISGTVSLLTSAEAIARADYRYADGKWSLKQIAGHLSDVERVLGYRLLRFARADTTELPGYEEDDYAIAAESDARSLPDLAAELSAVRASTVALLRGLPEGAWDRRGRANGVDVTVLALACIIAGHERHHIEIIRKRYLAQATTS